jgi:hypothetical protein
VSEPHSFKTWASVYTWDGKPWAVFGETVSGSKWNVINGAVEMADRLHDLMPDAFKTGYPRYGTREAKWRHLKRHRGIRFHRVTITF